MSRPSWRERNPHEYNAAWRRWYRENSAKKIAWQARRREELRQWLHELRSTKQCERCTEAAPECLHFHHTDPRAKEINLGEVISQGWSKKRILAELAKCIVLCANCHLKHHWHEQHGT